MSLIGNTKRRCLAMARLLIVADSRWVLMLVAWDTRLVESMVVVMLVAVALQVRAGAWTRCRCLRARGFGSVMPELCASRWCARRVYQCGPHASLPSVF